MNHSENLKDGFMEIIAFLHDADEKVLNGQNCDLTGIEARISALCKRTARMNKEDAAALAPLLRETISRLDELEFNLRSLRERQDPG